VRKVGFALYRASEYPPGASAPVATLMIEAQEGQAVDFPLDFSIVGLSTGDYFLDIYGDVVPQDTAAGANVGVDPAVTGVGPLSIRIDQVSAQVAAVLEEPRSPADVVEDDSAADVVEDGSPEDVAADWLTPADVAVTPQSGKAAIFGTVAWGGDAEGTLTILGFAASPPNGPPTLIKYVKSPEFPQFFSMDDVSPGTYYMVVYLDVDLSDGMTNQPVDPVSDGFRPVTVQAGDSVLQDFWLNLADPQ